MSRNDALTRARAMLDSIHPREFYEVPLKADVLYELRDYGHEAKGGAEAARTEIPFLFKPFEVGQKPPPTKGQEPPFGREPTIHEYLDWTVTAASNLETLDFSGFRVLTLLPRYRPMWPPPSGEDRPQETPREGRRLGAPKEPVPLLMPYGRPISATTIRCGPDYVEVPFFATKQSARGKGYGKALLYAIEDICRYLGLSKILLCSTDDAGTISTWQHLGFRHTLPHELAEWGIAATELVHMTNTVQMVKFIEEEPVWKAIRVRHEGFDQRLYYLPTSTTITTSTTQATGKKRKEQQQQDHHSNGPSDEMTNHKVSRAEPTEQDLQRRSREEERDDDSGSVAAVVVVDGCTLENGRSMKAAAIRDQDDVQKCDRNNIIEQHQHAPIQLTSNKKGIGGRTSTAKDICAESA